MARIPILLDVGILALRFFAVRQMSFLGGPAEEKLPSRRVRQRRRRMADALIEKFGRAFPEITYDLMWASPSLNAQAWRIGSVRCVRLYGGLARYPAMTQAGLALTLAHETGHHLGGAPFDPILPSLSSQGQADYWAASAAMPRLWGARARAMTLRGARELLALHGAFAARGDDDKPDLPAGRRYCVLRAGALGEAPPAWAGNALASSEDDQRGLQTEGNST
jgi:hypothetical protein